MANLYFSYKNLLENVSKITDSNGTANTNYGTQNIFDFDINSSFRSNAGEGTQTTLDFDFGSSVYIDTAIAIHNLALVGTLVLKAGSTTGVGNYQTALPMMVEGTAVKYFNSQGYRYWQLRMENYLLRNGNFEDVETGGTLTNWTHVGEASAKDSGWITGTTLKYGNWGFRNTPQGTFLNLYQLVDNYKYFGGTTVTLGAWVKTSTPNGARLLIRTGIQTLTSPYHSGNNDWEWLTINGTPGTNLTQLKCELQIRNFIGTTVYCDGMVLKSTPGGTHVEPNDFNKPSGYHELKQLFLGKRLELSENPDILFLITDNENVTSLTSEKGQTYNYHNFRQRMWSLNYSAIPKASYIDLVNMRRFCGGGYKPLFLCIDPSNEPEETYFTRFVGQTFTYTELVSEVAFSVNFILQQDL